jgi:zinc ribbon protein
MYCPRCAAQNLDDAKFCRGCGTSLENVALALSGQYQPAPGDFDDDYEPPKTWLELRREGVNKLVKAGGLLGSSFLIGLALGLFSNTNDWIIIWMVFTGWMATWGVFCLVSGTAAMMESRLLRGQLAPGTNAPRRPAAGQGELITGELVDTRLPAPRSVTEHTTKSLSERRPTSKQAD